MTLSGLSSLVTKLGGRVAVFGDVMLDKYTYGVVSRISPEAPVPIIERKFVEYRLGGASNVARNIKALGGEPLLFGVVGNDFEGQKLRSMLREQGVGDCLVTDNRPTTKKHRIVAHNQHVVRVDSETVAPIGGEIEDRLAASLTGVECVVVSDYGKGVVTEGLYEKILSHFSGPVICDPKRHMEFYRKSFAVTPNLAEFRKFTGRGGGDNDIDDGDRSAAKHLMTDYDIKNVLITKGEKGITLFDADGEFSVSINGFDVVDITGAGDTVVAALALCAARGFDIRSAAFLANCAAGVVVTKLGTASLTKEELLEHVKRAERG